MCVYSCLCSPKKEYQEHGYLFIYLFNTKKSDFNLFNEQHFHNTHNEIIALTYMLHFKYD